MSRPHTLESMKAKCLLDDDGCWLWQGAKDKCGYGRTSYYEKSCTAHRLAYRLDKGDIPEGKHILHDCDKPNCINPEHLRVGTHKDNMKDMAQRGRSDRRPGEKNLSAKLNRQKVETIRKMLDQGVSRAYLSGLYDVSLSTIQHIAQRRSWV